MQALVDEFQIDAMKQFDTQAKFQIHLMSKYDDKLAEQYGLTRELLEQISVEVFNEDWPFPKRKYL